MSKWAKQEPTLSDFMEMEIRRTGEHATVVFDYNQGHPIALYGFRTNSWKKDFDIREEAFMYYQMLREQAAR